VFGGPQAPDTNEVLQLAASLDQVSPHPLASGLATCARERRIPLTLPDEVVELPGYGLSGTVEGRRVRLGKADWIIGEAAPLWVRQVRRRAAMEGALTVFAEVDGEPAGAFLFDDPIRPDAARMIRQLKRAGIRRTVLVTGDRAEVAESVGRIVGVDAVAAERDPAEKVALVRSETTHGNTVMVGDGVNDAPALAAASVGVALASQGASASSQTADVVLTVDRLGALATAITVARRSRRIALEAVTVGMGLSLVAMVAAALGLLPPVVGALLQEGIDLLAIAIALRAVRPGPARPIALSPQDSALITRLAAEHPHIHRLAEQVRTTADSLVLEPVSEGREPAGGGLGEVRRLLTVLQADLLPHEREEEELLYPVVARLIGGDDPLGPLSRSHVEIAHYVGRMQRLIDEIGDQPLGLDDVIELRRLLYGLYAVMRLHNAQEEEAAFSLAEPAGPG
jgi:soluble P-type ATPase